MNIITTAVFLLFLINKETLENYVEHMVSCLPAAGVTCVGLRAFLICRCISFEFLHQGESLHASVPFLFSKDTFVELPHRAIYYSTPK